MRSAEQTRSIYRGITLFWLALAAVTWFWSFEQVGFYRMFAIAAAIVFGWFWLSTSDRIATSDAPDVLGERFDRYYEHAGLCFAPQLTVEDGVCWFNLHCQNRFANLCRGTIYLVPMEGLSKDGPHEVPPFMADVEFDGGEVGVVSIPYPINAKWQGKVMIYDAFATVQYPNSCGKCVRATEGIMVGAPTKELRDTLLTAGLLAFGIVRISSTGSSASKWECTLPTNVADAVQDEQTIRTESLWQLPTKGFPVTPADRDA